MCEAVQQGAGQPLRAQDLRPLVEGQVGVNMLSGPVVVMAKYVRRVQYLEPADYREWIESQQLAL